MDPCSVKTKKKEKKKEKEKKDPCLELSCQNKLFKTYVWYYIVGDLLGWMIISGLQLIQLVKTMMVE